jgi:hypothetical protein
LSEELLTSQLVERTSLLDRKIKEIEERERQRKQVYRMLVERTSLLDRRIKEIEEPSSDH